MSEAKGVLLVAVIGLPLTGKSAIARGVSQMFGIRHLDIDDDIRLPIFGKPDADPYRDEARRAAASAEMGQAYDLLLAAAESCLILGRSVILTATFSRKSSRAKLLVLEARYNALLRVIWCHSDGYDTDEAVAARLAGRVFGVNYFGGCNSVEHYRDDQKRYEPMSLPHREIDTFRYGPGECIEFALDYVAHKEG